MLNDYDEWYCDECEQRCYPGEIVFTVDGRDLCDGCFDAEERE